MASADRDLGAIRVCHQRPRAEAGGVDLSLAGFDVSTLEMEKPDKDGAENSPSIPRHARNGRGRGFAMTKPNGPENHGESIDSTQSTMSTCPMIPPRSRSSGTTTPSWNATSYPTGSTRVPAWIKSGPRYEVRQVRFSTFLNPYTISQAHGWRMDSAFMRLGLSHAAAVAQLRSLAETGLTP